MTIENPTTAEDVLQTDTPEPDYAEQVKANPLTYPRFNRALYDGTDREQAVAARAEITILTNQVWALIPKARTCEIMHLEPAAAKKAKRDRIPGWLRVVGDMGLFLAIYAVGMLALVGGYTLLWHFGIVG